MEYKFQNCGTFADIACQSSKTLAGNALMLDSSRSKLVVSSRPISPSPIMDHAKPIMLLISGLGLTNPCHLLYLVLSLLCLLLLPNLVVLTPGRLRLII